MVPVLNPENAGTVAQTISTGWNGALRLALGASARADGRARQRDASCRKKDDHDQEGESRRMPKRTGTLRWVVLAPAALIHQ